MAEYDPLAGVREELVTVAQLIEMLRSMPQDAIVGTVDSEYGLKVDNMGPYLVSTVVTEHVHGGKSVDPATCGPFHHENGMEKCYLMRGTGYRRHISVVVIG